MKTIYPTIAALTVILTPALAMSATEVDANGDGMLTIEEVQAVYPEVTADSFSAMDTSGDGALDDEEVKAAQAAGLMETPSSN
ncbi:EF-hand domain-containing protein [Marimonas lutisalis]|uniref:hypothetical protein n=1 Tax=Marimonas lutisalis TaxID=2545756 RepID=UPI00187495CC|nr:hypothetical protein [Marimonas lutisalis]